MSGTVAVDVLDVYGDHIPERVDLFFHNSAGGSMPYARAQDASKTIPLPGLLPGYYRLEVDVPCYKDFFQFVNVFNNETTLVKATALVDPRRVIAVVGPTFDGLPAFVKEFLQASCNTLHVSDARMFYETLDAIPKAGLLNVTAKASRTRQTNGKAVFSEDYFDSLLEIRGDRLFAIVDESLFRDTQDSALHDIFHQVSEALHQVDGCVPLKSYKTADHFGNLQLSFFRRSADNTLVVDMDIDDAQGFEHVFQVLTNAITGEPTHPYNIHEILVGMQNIDPGYTLQVRSGSAAAGAGG